MALVGCLLVEAQVTHRVSDGYSAVHIAHYDSQVWLGRGRQQLSG